MSSSIVLPLIFFFLSLFSFIEEAIIMGYFSNGDKTLSRSFCLYVINVLQFTIFRRRGYFHFTNANNTMCDFFVHFLLTETTHKRADYSGSQVSP